MSCPPWSAVSLLPLFLLLTVLYIGPGSKAQLVLESAIK